MSSGQLNQTEMCSTHSCSPPKLVTARLPGLHMLQCSVQLLQHR
jgi:hypothetical protein